MTKPDVREVAVRVEVAEQGGVVTIVSILFATGLRQVGTAWQDSKVKAKDLMAFLWSCEDLDITPRNQGIDPPALSAFLDGRDANLKT